MENTHCRPQKFVVSLLFGERGPLNWWNLVLKTWNSDFLAKKAAFVVDSAAFWLAWAFRRLHFNVYHDFSSKAIPTSFSIVLKLALRNFRTQMLEAWSQDIDESKIRKFQDGCSRPQRASRTFIMIRRSVHQVEGHISWTWPLKDTVCELLIGRWSTAFITIVNTFSVEQLSDMFNSVPSLDKVSPTYYSKMSQESQILLEINAETFKLIKRTI